MATAPDTPHLADPETNPSFTRGVFLGEIREDLVFPFPEPSAEEKESLAAILDAFRSWAADNLDPAQLDHDGKFPDAVRQGMAELGLMGLNIPEAYGGFGASAMVFNRVFGEIGAHDASLAVYFGAHQSIGIKGIILFGTEAQKQQWLPRCASGELIGAFCLTEPGSGSDAQAMLASAVPSEDGSQYVLAKSFGRSSSCPASSSPIRAGVHEPQGRAIVRILGPAQHQRRHGERCKPFGRGVGERREQQFRCFEIDLHRLHELDR